MKKILVVLLGTILLLLFASCNLDINKPDAASQKEENKEIKYEANFESLLITDPTQEYIDSTAPQKRTVEVNGTRFTLDYINTIVMKSNPKAVYYNEEKGVTAYFNASNKLCLLNLDMEKLPLEEVINLPEFCNDEQTYVDWCKEFLKEFGMSDNDEYVYSCTSISTLKGENYLRKHFEDYFVSTETYAPNESYYLRSFTFSKVINGLKTSDEYIVRIADDCVIFILNEDNLSDRRLGNQEDAAMALDEFIKKKYNRVNGDDKLCLDSYTIENVTMDFIGGKPCYLFDVIITYELENTDREMINDPTIIAVTVE